MTEATQYNRDPITEALLDIRIVPSVQVTKEGLLAALSPLSADYPESAQLVNLVSEVSVGAEIGASARQIPGGIAHISADKKQMLKAQPDGMTFNRLSPYPGWEAFRDEARRLWNIYRTYTQPQQIKQISVRYINKLNVPGDAFVEDYLNLFPAIPDNLPGPMEGFFIQTQMALPELEAIVLLNEAIVPSSDPGKGSVLLDITILRSTELKDDEEFLWGLFEQFRLRKNQIFESLITDKTRELIG